MSGELAGVLMNGAIMKKVINEVARTVTFTFGEGVESVVFATSKMSVENTDYAILHGMAARIGDNAAITKSAENNFTVTEAMRRAAVMEMVGHYENVECKDWNLKARAAKAVFNPVIQKIAEKRNCTYEEAAAWYNEKLMAELDAM